MDHHDSFSSNIIPSCIIRSETSALPSVCAGIQLSSFPILLPPFSPSIASIPVQTTPIASSSTSSTLNLESPNVEPTWERDRRALNSKRLHTAPHTSKGIFDSSSDDDVDLGEWKWQPTGDQTPANSETSHFPIKTENPSVIPSSPLSGLHSRIIYVGSTEGSISIYESSNGRRLATIEAAHSNSSILSLQELHSLPSAIVFASHGRDGFVRFWKLSLEPCKTDRMGNTAEFASKDLPGMPELENMNMKVVIHPYRSPLFVGGEGFCKISFELKSEFLAAYCDRGMIGLWHYRSFLDHQDQSERDNPEQDVNAALESDLAISAPKCIISYNGDHHGMCMSLQLGLERVQTEKSRLKPENAGIILFAGFEDGSISSWHISDQPIVNDDITSKEVVYGWKSDDRRPQSDNQSVSDSFDSYSPLRTSLVMIPSLISNLKVFDSSTPVLALSARKLDEILRNQSLSSSTSSKELENIATIQISGDGNVYGWVGVCTSAEDEMITFALTMQADQHNFAIMEKYKMPHAGYGDVKLRGDSMLAVGGWDGRIRLFLLEAFSSLKSDDRKCEPYSISDYGLGKNVIVDGRNEKMEIGEKNQFSSFASSSSDVVGVCISDMSVSFKIRELAILRYHSASVQSISLVSSEEASCDSLERENGVSGAEEVIESGSEIVGREKKGKEGLMPSSMGAMLCSVANDHKVAVWRVF